MPAPKDSQATLEVLQGYTLQCVGDQTRVTLCKASKHLNPWTLLWPYFFYDSFIEISFAVGFGPYWQCSYLSALYSGIMPSGRPFRMPGIKLRSAACKANILARQIPLYYDPRSY